MALWWQSSCLRGFSEPSRERCTQSSLCDAIILTVHHRAGMMAGHLSSEGVSFSPIKSYRKAWILCKMLEKSKFLSSSNTRGKAESSKDFRKLSPVMGRKCACPPACLVDRMEEARNYPGCWSVLYYGWLPQRPFHPLTQKSLCSETDISLPYLFLNRVLLFSSGLHRTDRYRPISTFQVLGVLCPTTANLGLGFLNHVYH